MIIRKISPYITTEKKIEIELGSNDPEKISWFDIKRRSLQDLKTLIFIEFGIDIPRQLLTTKDGIVLEHRGDSREDNAHKFTKEIIMSPKGKENFIRKHFDYYRIPDNIKEIHVYDFFDYFEKETLSEVTLTMYPNIRFFFPLIEDRLYDIIYNESSYSDMSMSAAMEKSIMQTDHEFLTKKVPDIPIDTKVRFLKYSNIIFSTSASYNPRNIFESLKLDDFFLSASLVMKDHNGNKFYEVTKQLNSRPEEHKVPRKKHREFLSIKINTSTNKSTTVYIYQKRIDIEIELNEIMGYNFKDTLEHGREIQEEIVSKLNLRDREFFLADCNVSFKTKEIYNSSLLQMCLENAAANVGIVSYEDQKFILTYGLYYPREENVYAMFTKSIFKNHFPFTINGIEDAYLSIGGIFREDDIKFISDIIVRIIASIDTEDAQRDKENANIRKLRNNDPALFGPEISYGRKCQKKNQPIPITAEEQEALTEEEKLRTHKGPNYTTGKQQIYFCPDPENPHIKYLGGHVLGYCTPCCRKKDTSKTEINQSCTTPPYLYPELKKEKDSNYKPKAKGDKGTPMRVYRINEALDEMGISGIFIGSTEQKRFHPVVNTIALIEQETVETILENFEDKSFLMMYYDDKLHSSDINFHSLLSKYGITIINIKMSEDTIFSTLPVINSGKHFIIITEINGGYYVLTKSSLNVYKSKSDIVFTNEDPLLLRITKNMPVNTNFGLSTIEAFCKKNPDYSIKAQLKIHKHSVINFIRLEKNGELFDIGVTPYDKDIRFISMIDTKFNLPPLDLLLELSKKEYIKAIIRFIVFNDKVIGLFINDIPVFCRDTNIPEKSNIPKVLQRYNIRDMHLDNFSNTKILQKDTIIKEYSESIPEIKYKYWLYEIASLQLIQYIQSSPRKTTLTQLLENGDKETWDKVCKDIFIKVDKLNLKDDISNRISHCFSNDFHSYCKENKVKIHKSMYDLITKTLLHDIVHNFYIDTLITHKEELMILDKFRFNVPPNIKIEIREYA